LTKHRDTTLLTVLLETHPTKQFVYKYKEIRNIRIRKKKLYSFNTNYIRFEKENKSNQTSR